MFNQQIRAVEVLADILGIPQEGAGKIVEPEGTLTINAQQLEELLRWGTGEDEDDVKWLARTLNPGKGLSELWAAQPLLPNNPFWIDDP